jgi:hypothetical protein
MSERGMSDHTGIAPVNVMKRRREISMTNAIF